MSVLALALALMGLLWVSVLLVFAAPLVARWREPVLTGPVLIIESDDWGAGPLAQAAALTSLTSLLQRIRDRSGRPAVMTLGVVLEVPDGKRIAASGCTEYHALTLADACFADVRAAMQSGIQAGVFAPQLHGQCHYWPSALLAAAQGDSTVRSWLTAHDPAATEDLPAHLQSSWIDASCLPSRELAPEAIQQAAAAEAAAYQAAFGNAPQVAVATTFVWNEAVEAAWGETGIQTLITPGRRATCRNVAGQPGCVDATMLTGERSSAGQTYLVRDVFFEPVLGHAPQRLVDGLQTRTRQGRACLIETHRFNFLQQRDAPKDPDPPSAEDHLKPYASLDTLEAGLRAALAACPEVRFTSPLELAHAIRCCDPVWIERRLRPRLVAWYARLDEIPRFHRMAQLSGLDLVLAWLGRAA